MKSYAYIRRVKKINDLIIMIAVHLSLLNFTLKRFFKLN